MDISSPAKTMPIFDIIHRTSRIYQGVHWTLLLKRITLGVNSGC